MEIEIVGCYGSKDKNKNTSTYLIKDGNFYTAIDAGSLATIDDEKQAKVKHTFITHSHADHWTDLQSIAYNNIMPHKDYEKTRQINVHGTKPTIDAIIKDGFEGKTWVPFHKIDVNGIPIKFNEINYRNGVKTNNLNIRAFPVKHNEGACAYLVKDKKSAVLFLGDTGQLSKEFYKKFKNNSKLKNIIIETTYPNSMTKTNALPFNHLTPELVTKEIEKLGRDDVTFWTTHFFPRYATEIRNEIRELMKKGYNIKSLFQDFICKF